MGSSLTTKRYIIILKSGQNIKAVGGSNFFKNFPDTLMS